MTLSYEVQFRGFPACPCLAAWLPVYEHELQRRGILSGPLHIYQLIGGAPASAGTHTKGGAEDDDRVSDQAIWVARQMGADASWHRRPNWDGAGGMEHAHHVLRGCPHNGPARYQIDAVDAGYNGLGYLGHAAKDDGPRPLSGRTWQQGITWAKEQENNMALLADLTAVAKKYGVSRVYAARVLLRAAAAAALAARKPARAARINAARTDLKGMS